jgi:xanthine dehydrogenase YagS FAD-binding subunit
MRPFRYFRPSKAAEAVEMIASDPNARLIAGGTNLVDLMKRGVVVPETLIDINSLPFKKIEQKKDFIRIGALVSNSEVAADRIIASKHPLLIQALNAGASGQLRNMATVGGNIMQQTRCTYFYDTALPCNKRVPNSGCGALDGINRMHAIFGLSENNLNSSCIAVHPSDMCVALLALEASVLVLGPAGERRIAFVDFHRLPGKNPEKDTNLEKGEMIVGVEIPDAPVFGHVHYLKVRDRASYAFALLSVAVALNIDEQKRIVAVRLAMGGVAHKPWRLHEAEKLLTGQIISEDLFENAGQVSMEGAKSFKHNFYKLKLAPNAIVQALKIAAGFAS